MIEDLKIEDSLEGFLEDQGNPGTALSATFWLTAVVMAVILFGLTMLYSTSYGGASGDKFFKMQLLWLAIALVCGIVVILIGYRTLAKWSPLLLVILLFLLIIPLFGEPVNGARRWINIGVGSFKFKIQPSEFAKILLPLFLTKYYADNFRTIDMLFKKTGPFPPLILAGGIIGLVALGKDLGTTALLCATVATTLFFAGFRLRYLLTLGGLALAGMYILSVSGNSMRQSRITTFLNPELYREEGGYQLMNSLMALGSGGWTGIGFLGSRLKEQYLPEAHTDFILSIIGEELGLVGLVCLIAAYFLIVFFGYRISMHSRSRQGMLLAGTFISVFLFQVIINIGVVSGSLPTKGMSAPFISYGGSGMIVYVVIISLLLSVALDTAFPNYNKPVAEFFKKHLLARLNGRRES